MIVIDWYIIIYVLLKSCAVNNKFRLKGVGHNMELKYLENNKLQVKRRTSTGFENFKMFLWWDVAIAIFFQCGLGENILEKINN